MQRDVQHVTVNSEMGNTYDEDGIIEVVISVNITIFCDLRHI